mgnify:CR=1 FL=1
MTDPSSRNLERLLAEQQSSLPSIQWTYKGAEASRIHHDYPSKHEEIYGLRAEMELSPLAALAPQLAQEVLRLRAGVERLMEMCLLERDAAFQDAPMRAGEVTAFNLCAERLTDLLTGDHDG